MKLPDPLEKREWIYNQKEGQSKLKELGFAYLERKNYNDACDCFDKIEDEEGLVKIKAIAIEDGDAFLAQKIQGDSALSKEEWQKLAKNAQSKGKFHFTIAAYTAIGEEEKVEELREQFGIEKQEV